MFLWLSESNLYTQQGNFCPGFNSDLKSILFMFWGLNIHFDSTITVNYTMTYSCYIVLSSDFSKLYLM